MYHFVIAPRGPLLIFFCLHNFAEILICDNANFAWYCRLWRFVFVAFFIIFNFANCSHYLDDFDQFRLDTASVSDSPPSIQDSLRRRRTSLPATSSAHYTARAVGIDVFLEKYFSRYLIGACRSITRFQCLAIFCSLKFVKINVRCVVLKRKLVELVPIVFTIDTSFRGCFEEKTCRIGPNCIYCWYELPVVMIEYADCASEGSATVQFAR